MAEVNALGAFHWNKGHNPAGLPDANMFCLRKALCLLMGWGPGSAEWNSFPPGPPGTDLERLVVELPELALRLHRVGDPDVPGDIEGIVTGKIQTPFGPIDHAEYGKLIADVEHIFILGTISGVITRHTP
jgi:hypothetical protein